MYIVMGTENVRNIEQNYTVLELDTLRFSKDAPPVTAFCVIENMPITEMFSINNYKELHHNMMKNYRVGNWKFCKDAIDHLQGRWAGELDSFYHELLSRIENLEQQSCQSNWDGVINRF